jgi:hypothetical protein
MKNVQEVTCFCGERVLHVRYEISWMPDDLFEIAAAGQEVEHACTRSAATLRSLALHETKVQKKEPRRSR